MHLGLSIFILAIIILDINVEFKLGGNEDVSLGLLCVANCIYLIELVLLIYSWCKIKDIMQKSAFFELKLSIKFVKIYICIVFFSQFFEFIGLVISLLDILDRENDINTLKYLKLFCDKSEVNYTYYLKLTQLIYQYVERFIQLDQILIAYAILKIKRHDDQL